MKEKNLKSLNSVLIAIGIIVTLFFIYELIIVGNPFFDPIVPYFLWFFFFIILVLFVYRYVYLIKNNKEDL